jgi:hypothetical protein
MSFTTYFDEANNQKPAIARHHASPPGFCGFPISKRTRLAQVLAAFEGCLRDHAAVLERRRGSGMIFLVILTDIIL